MKFLFLQPIHGLCLERYTRKVSTHYETPRNWLRKSNLLSSQICVDTFPSPFSPPPISRSFFLLNHAVVVLGVSNSEKKASSNSVRNRPGLVIVRKGLFRLFDCALESQFWEIWFCQRGISVRFEVEITRLREAWSNCGLNSQTSSETSRNGVRTLK